MGAALVSLVFFAASGELRRGHTSVIMKRSGRKIEMDDAHGNLRASVLLGLCHKSVGVVGSDGSTL